MPNVFHPRRCRTARRLILAGLLGAAAIPVLGRAADIGSQPQPVIAPPASAAAPDTPADDAGAHSRPANPPRADDGPASTEEVLQAKKFIAQQSPNKWQMYENLPPEGKLRKQLEQQLVQRFRDLQRMRVNDRERHDLEATAIRIEDEIYGVLRELDAALREERDAAEQEQRLREKVDELVQNRDRWRVKRLERIARELRSMSGTNLDRALKPVQEEIARIQALGPEDRRGRVDNRVKEFKQKMTHTKLRPHLARPLPGGDRPPVGVPQPGAEPTSAPVNP